MRRLIIALLALASIILFAISTLHAQELPVYTGNFCVNKTTGAIRDLLINKPQKCRKTEVLASFLNLSSAPTPDATPSADPSATPTPDPTASPTPTPQPSASPTPSASNCQQCVVDSTGAEVGPLEPILPPYDELVFLVVKGVPMELGVYPGGFIDNFNQQGLGLVLWYPTQDCSGQGYMVVYNQGGGGQNLDPLVQVNTSQFSPYVFQNVVWYAQPPYSQITMHSLQGFSDPSQPSTTGCETPGNTAPDYGTLLAGVPTSFNLSSLGFVPPFEAQ